MYEEVDLRNPAIIGYLVKKILEMYPAKQVDTTIVHKMIFLLVAKGVFRFYYSMSYSGPGSWEVGGELDYAKILDIVHITWEKNLGYFIYPAKKNADFEYLLSGNEKKEIDQLVKNFGSLSALELSILASSIFIKTRFNTPEEKLPEIIQSIKPRCSLPFIEKVIKKQSVLQMK